MKRLRHISFLVSLLLLVASDLVVAATRHSPVPAISATPQSGVVVRLLLGVVGNTNTMVLGRLDNISTRVFRSEDLRPNEPLRWKVYVWQLKLVHSCMSERNKLISASKGLTYLIPRILQDGNEFFV